ncbi:MAG: hypothetical protein MUC97_03880 [Bernardetiaceae bacterium]|jgi:hypothetical protein|nr:hypothetical protein [Bernardetiaceae bacterium]
MALGLGFAAQAQTSLAPTYSNEFLSVGVGARALGMANTQVAVANDVTAGYWNPAGLLNIKEKYQASLMHAEYFGGVANYDYGGFAAKLDESGAIGFSVIRMGVDNIPDTRFLIDNVGNINYNNVGSFSDASYAFMFSYARESALIKGLRAGASAKVIHRTAGSFATAWGFGLDVGAQLTRGRWHFGAVGRDLTSTFNVWNYNPEAFRDVFSRTGNLIPNNSVELTLPRAILEAGREFNFGPHVGAVLTTGFTFTFDGRRNALLQTSRLSGDWQAGAELHYRQTVFVRGGLGNYQRLQNLDGSQVAQMQPSFGVGFRVLGFQIDYALANFLPSEAVIYSHVFSLKGSFADKKEEKKK